MDALTKAVHEDSRIRFSWTDVTVAAKALEARHLSGPTAALALSEGLVAVSLISQDAAHDDEATLLRVNATGPLRGLTVEAMGSGGLRGFTNTKVLNELDGANTITTDQAWGRSGAVQVVISRPGTILSRASLNVNPPRMQQILARYFNFSLQVPTAVALHTHVTSGGILRATGMLAQRMPDGDSDTFVRVLERFEDGSIERLLGETVAVDTVARAFALSGLAARDEHPLRFECRCSRARTLSALKALPLEELDEMTKSGATQSVICHMCGKGYTATTEDLARALAERRADEQEKQED